MISFDKFIELFNLLSENEEMKIFFKNRKYEYMIIKYKDYVTFQRCGEHKEIKYNSLEEFINNKMIDDIVFIDEFDNIKDILINNTFSIINDKDNICDLYSINI